MPNALKNPLKYLVVYGSAALAVGATVYPWITSSGYVFLLDYVTGPADIPPRLSEAFSLAGWLPKQLLWLVSHIVPVAIVQKSYLAALILGSWWSMSYLTDWLLRRHQANTSAAIVLAGFWYALNPFTIQRLYMGQHLLLLAYALTPLALLTWLQFFAKPSYKRAAAGALLAGAVYASSVHHIVLFSLVLLIITPYKRLKTIPKRYTGVLAALLCAIAGAFLAHQVVFSTTTLPLDPRGPEIFQVRAPVSGSVVVDSLLLSATWNTTLPLAAPFETMPLYIWAQVVLLGIASIGAYALAKQRKAFAQKIVLLAGVAIFFTIGLAHPASRTIARWLYENVPLWIGMRDAGKFLALLALAQSILVGYGVAFGYTRLRGRIHKIIFEGICIVCAVILFVPTIRGFSGQIVPSPYPNSWHTWNSEMERTEKMPRMLFLPWHQYLSFSFTDKRNVVHPAPKFFTAAHVIAADTVEAFGPGGTPYLYSESDREISKEIEHILQSGQEHQHTTARMLSKLDIQFVALALDNADADTFEWLFHEPGLAVVFQESDLVVFENTHLLSLQ